MFVHEGHEMHEENHVCLSTKDTKCTKRSMYVLSTKDTKSSKRSMYVLSTKDTKSTKEDF
jgi:hypothetical protein